MRSAGTENMTRGGWPSSDSVRYGMRDPVSPRRKSAASRLLSITVRMLNASARVVVSSVVADNSTASLSFSLAGSYHQEARGAWLVGSVTLR